MPHAEFLESYPLFKKLQIAIPNAARQIPKPNITMDCDKCKSGQTFSMWNQYWDGHGNSDTNPYRLTLISRYRCVRCGGFEITFLIEIGLPADGWIRKVGQYPAMDLKIDPFISKMLGSNIENYKKGLTCESYGYGIGAYAYYRRIVETTLDKMLDMIPALLDADKRAAYAEVLAKAKVSHHAAEKIELVKDRLPEMLRPGGVNPLGTLYGYLSDGIHSRSDEECLDIAFEIRAVLEFLIGELMRSTEAQQAYVDGLNRLLEKKSQKK